MSDMSVTGTHLTVICDCILIIVEMKKTENFGTYKYSIFVEIIRDAQR